MQKFGHTVTRVWRFTTIAILTIITSHLSMAQPKQLDAIAIDVSGTPGAAELIKRYESLKEDGFEMRFRILDIADAAKWNGLDLKSRGEALKVQHVDGGVEVLLPNGGKCVISLSQTPDGEVYNVRFSGGEVGIPAALSAKRGNILLLGAPQNNAHDASFVQVTLSEQKK